jgi:tRNA-specific 2-thiouridylase
MDQEMLRRTLFPLGDLFKEDVVEKGRSLGFPVDELRESQEVCFVNRGGYQGFVADRFPESVRPGKMVTVSGDTVGDHRGIAFHTVGQRRGLGVAALERQYVVRLDPERNEVILGSQTDLLCRDLTAGDVHWISGRSPVETETPFPTRARIRYRSEAVEAAVTLMENERVRVTFAQPQKAVAPGQSVVFYREDRVIGGGIIQP